MNIRERVEDVRSFITFVTHQNPATGETGVQILRRRIRSLEEHMRNLEDRYALLEERLNLHAQGTQHRTPKPNLPKPDEE